MPDAARQTVDCLNGSRIIRPDFHLTIEISIGSGKEATAVSTRKSLGGDLLSRRVWHYSHIGIALRNPLRQSRMKEPEEAKLSILHHFATPDEFLRKTL